MLHHSPLVVIFYPLIPLKKSENSLKSLTRRTNIPVRHNYETSVPKVNKLVYIRSLECATNPSTNKMSGFECDLLTNLLDVVMFMVIGVIHLDRADFSGC